MESNINNTKNQNNPNNSIISNDSASNNVNSSGNATQFNFCPHIKTLDLNDFVTYDYSSNLNSIPNLYNLINNPKLNTYTREREKKIYDNFFIRNISLDWVALYNQQNISFESINRDGCIFTVSFSDDGSVMASSNHNHNIEIWDTEQRKIKKVITDHKEIVTGLEFFHNSSNIQTENTYMMSCSLDKTIKLWKDYQSVHTYLDHSDWVRCLAISKYNKYFLSGCVSSVIKLWDIEKSSVINTISNVNPDPELLNTVNSLAFMNSSENVFLCGLRNGMVKIFDSRINKPNLLVKEFKAHKSKLNTVKFNSKDKFLLSSGRDSIIRLWDYRKLPVNIYLYT